MVWEAGGRRTQKIEVEGKKIGETDDGNQLMCCVFPLILSYPFTKPRNIFISSYGQPTML
jgi:hypothetical protein